MQSIIHSDIDVNEDDCGKLRQIIGEYSQNSPRTLPAIYSGILKTRN